MHLLFDRGADTTAHIKDNITLGRATNVEPRPKDEHHSGTEHECSGYTKREREALCLVKALYITTQFGRNESRQKRPRIDAEVENAKE